jgi:hypothetical protein
LRICVRHLGLGGGAVGLIALIGGMLGVVIIVAGGVVPDRRGDRAAAAPRGRTGRVGRSVYRAVDRAPTNAANVTAPPTPTRGPTV